MCVLCSEWLIAKMNIKEIDAALAELVDIAETTEDIEHLFAKYVELKQRGLINKDDI